MRQKKHFPSKHLNSFVLIIPSKLKKIVLFKTKMTEIHAPNKYTLLPKHSHHELRTIRETRTWF